MVVQLIRSILECLSFYKDVVAISKEARCRKLDQYLHQEGKKLNACVFNTDAVEGKL